MKIEILFYTQLASVFGFITALFVLYRLLIKQKDAVIELLREQVVSLEKKVEALEKQSPDALVESLHSRVENCQS